MPLFEGKGTLQDFQHWVDARAAEYDRSGKVILTFVVEKNGSVAEVQVLDTPDPAMGEAAARIVASSPASKMLLIINAFLQDSKSRASPF